MHFLKRSWRYIARKHVVKCYHIRLKSSSTASHPKKRVVLISESDVIHENLALEEWMYENTDFSDTDYLLMWRNKPAVVFGRHQNPWMEANIPLASSSGVDIARRSSGGGTVYHDKGNLNLSFLKARHRYNRKENLLLVTNAVRSRWDLDLMVNDRDDILLDHFYKVSGTAAKLGRTQSFHHFTLLLDVDTSQLRRFLDSPMRNVDSKATKSVPSSVQNLKEKAPDMTYETLVQVIGQSFLQEINQQMSHGNIQVINPINEADFPGINDIHNRLKSWEWIYGKTPKFSISRMFSGHEFLGHVCTLGIVIDIEKGHVVSVSISLDNENLQHLATALNVFYTQNFPCLILTRQNISHLQERCLIHFETLLHLEKSEVLSAMKWIMRCMDSCVNFM